VPTAEEETLQADVLLT